MTPLAHKIVRELTFPVKKRKFMDASGLTGRMSDIHCFELSEVHDLLIHLAKNISNVCEGPLACFLPAPKTWVEWVDGHGQRTGFLLEEGNLPGRIFVSDAVWLKQDGLEEMTTGIFERTPMWLGQRAVSSDEWDNRVSSWGDAAKEEGLFSADAFTPDNLVPAMLLLINSPKVIGRRQHMPHRGLERELTKAFKAQGKFPLHAWTEIKLEVSAPSWAGDDPSTEAHLTGQRAFHFCRSHLRVRLGRLEIVRAHWRGDASIGIKQSRYKVTPPAA